ncbi:hypothetical protein GUJ93_ZPchr0006g42870 [Zizania palustris]|uniref:Uncharacterized protein n=1 Tax=Zizania palustris TaxID=103762 RepID=A0A8J5SJ76_ZIZPA|nr:hypothetical protein GUJ93_ZPchr0006g42870 [Zizania palustris]
MAGGGGKDGVVVMAAAEPGVARRMWRVLRAVLYMLRRGLPSGRKLAMDLHLLLRRGKIAGKALGDLVTFHHHGHGGGSGGGAFSAAGSSLSCRAVDPALAVYEPSRGRREVEFSCSNTPSSTGGGGGFLGAARRRRRDRNHRRDDDVTAAGYDAAYIARVFEMLNDSEHLFNDDDDDDNHAPAVAPTTTSTSSTPPPAPCTPSYARSPAARRPRIITDSPFAAADEGQQVDRQADEFIRRFYEQLRAQRSVAATPDYYGGHGSRPLAAGIA